MIKAVLTFLLCLNPIGSQSKNMEPFVVGGNFSKIINFPHSAFLESYCGKVREAICGGSILNQRIILTAAHCMPSENCSGGQRVIARFGDVNKTSGIEIEALKYKSHEKYIEDDIPYDIGLVLLEKPLNFSDNVARVAIMQGHVRNNKIGTIAGWGYVNERTKTRTDLLKHVYQRIITRERCQEILGKLPEGVFCANDVKGISYPASGDSGCALVIDRYVQVGLVSYKMPFHPTIVVYTDISYFYDWIQENSMKLFCVLDDEESLDNTDATK